MVARSDHNVPRIIYKHEVDLPLSLLSLNFSTSVNMSYVMTGEFVMKTMPEGNAAKSSEI